MTAPRLGLWLRRALLVAGCAWGLTAWGVSRVRAQLRAALDPVVELAQLAPGAQRIWVNGLQFEVASGLSRRSPEEVLETLRTECQGLDGALGERLAGIWPDGLSPSVFELGTVRVGFVACLDLGREAWSFEELAARLGEAEATGDLAALGGVRIARVRPAGEGAHWVSVASRGPLPLARAFPDRGDAPGIDVPGAPRPAKARRILSARAEGHGATIASYALSGEHDPEAWLGQWRGAGWEVEPLGTPTPGAGSWHARRKGSLLLVSVQPQPDGGVASVVDLGETARESHD